LAAIVPATPDDSTWVVETGRPYPSATAIVAAAVISATHVREDRLLVGVGLFQRCQLAVEEACRYEASLARGEARGDQPTSPCK
jgi:hypothetical protein